MVVVVVVVVVDVVLVVALSSDPQAANDRAIKETPPAAAFAFFFSQTAANSQSILFVGSVHFSLKCTCRNHVHIFVPYKFGTCIWFFAIIEKPKIALDSKVKFTRSFVKHLSTKCVANLHQLVFLASYTMPLAKKNN